MALNPRPSPRLAPRMAVRAEMSGICGFPGLREHCPPGGRDDPDSRRLAGTPQAGQDPYAPPAGERADGLVYCRALLRGAPYGLGQGEDGEAVCRVREGGQDEGADGSGAVGGHNVTATVTTVRT